MIKKLLILLGVNIFHSMKMYELKPINDVNEISNKNKKIEKDFKQYKKIKISNF